MGIQEAEVVGDQNRKESEKGYQGFEDNWVVKEDCYPEDICDSRSMDSMESSSSCSSDLVEDASSSSSSSFNGPLYELSELMMHLPIRRGLSKYYQGKSQSFTSLAGVKSLEDLAKKVAAPYRRKMKPCKSYGGGLDNGQKSYSTSPKAIISKKAISRGSISSNTKRK
ncbi:PREDICTED: uncharacterized protein LOC101299700 [Fragaria vesca subsp. vesca]|uniref:uncharacterized protein LOC101299700 n=1 Tax=Fragaria vesca subsp. vesca TaxID=101020 RepID=UPI0002C30DB1|nr:PREDICTED: uncharacterized protein LOC101299700 [Fragaria vesca subsp. vesca]